MAIRLFAQVINDDSQENQLNNAPHDFILFNIGEYDEQTGIIIGNDNGPMSLMHGTEAHEPKTPETPAIQELLSRIDTCVNTIRNAQIESNQS